MNAKVIKRFKDKYTRNLYVPGDLFEAETARIEYLINLGYLKPIKIDFNSMTKKEIMKLLDGKGIEYDAKAKKDELIELLQGGD
ncbi:MAG: hypothetical protein GX241_07205 [Ruminococcaceae bacterium]|nr:hypothetical protein [Oscillospiraceae bacterium]